jgi:hypothetical protein
LAQVSLYLTEYIRRFGEYSVRYSVTRRLWPIPDTDLTRIRGDGSPTDGFSRAA